MSIESVGSRIAEIESRMAALPQSKVPSVSFPVAPVAPGSPAVPKQGFSTVMASIAGLPSSTPVLRPRSGELSFSTVDRPSFAATASSLPAAGVGGANPAGQLDGNDPLSARDLRTVLEQAGFSGESLRVAYALARRESGGRPAAESSVNGNGTRDHGLFQVNDVHRGSWIDFDRLDDPGYNASVAFRMSDKGSDFSAWGLGTTGWAEHLKTESPVRYAELLDRFQREYDKYPFA